VTESAHHDQRVACTVTLQGDCAALLRVTRKGLAVELRVGGAGEDGSSLAAGSTRVPIDRGIDAETRLELAVADGEARAMIDGREVARVPVPVDSQGPDRVEIGAVSDAGTSASARFADLRVDRDIVYEPSRQGSGVSTYDIPTDSFFFVGDNVKESEDSRVWTATPIRVRGRAEEFFAAAEVPDDKGAKVRNLVDRGGRVKFVDVDGIARDLPAADVTVGVAVHRPFVPRSHLVGRAWLVFWPWLVTDAGFRPRVLP
jgi:hypothetical protein